MAISPRSVSTKGYLDSPLSMAVDGYLGDVRTGTPLPWLGGAEVLLPTQGIAMVANTIGLISRALKAAASPLRSNRDGITRGEPGVIVKDEETGHE